MKQKSNKSNYSNSSFIWLRFKWLHLKVFILVTKIIHTREIINTIIKTIIIISLVDSIRLQESSSSTYVFISFRDS